MKHHNFFSNVNFLLVDDNAFMRSILRRILEPFGGSNIREASDGAEAFKIMNNWDTDIVLTDWVMSPVDGLEFTKQVRGSQRPEQRFLPIIFVSAHSENWRVAQARDAGATEYILKPITVNKVLSRISRVISDPRPFIQSPDYFGPDRRRRDMPYAVERRANATTPLAPTPPDPGADLNDPSTTPGLPPTLRLRT